MTTPAPHDLASCADVYAAMLAACAARQTVEHGLARTPEALARRDAADRAITALARDFARCAREEPLRPEIVLRALHAALDPLQRAIGYETRSVIRRAIDWYYATEAERRVSLRVTHDWDREAPSP